MEVLLACFAGPLPDSTAPTNHTAALTPQRPALTFPNQPIGDTREDFSLRGRATQVTQKKNRKEKREKNCGACYGVRVKETRIPSLLYQLNQYLWIERTQVLQQVESLTANLFRGSSEKIISPPFFSLPSLRFTFNWALLFALLITWKKVNSSCFVFILIFALIVVFTPCGPWWLRTVILWWCSLGQQLVQMGVNWVRMRGK